MQNNENHPNRRRIRNFFREKGYYIVLGLCVCAVGVSGWLFVSNAVSEKRSLQSETLSIATSAEDPQASRSSGGKTAPTTAPAAEETAPAAAMTDDSVREAAASVRVWPVSGEAQAAYSVDALQYNATTQDWRTHAGVDLTAAVGTPVRAAGSGVVTAVYDDEYLGTTSSSITPTGTSRSIPTSPSCRPSRQATAWRPGRPSAPSAPPPCWRSRTSRICTSPSTPTATPSTPRNLSDDRKKTRRSSRCGVFLFQIKRAGWPTGHRAWSGRRSS